MSWIIGILQLLLQAWNKWDVHRIMSNHLPHIEKEIKGVKIRLTALEDRNTRVDEVKEDGGL